MVLHHGGILTVPRKLKVSASILNVRLHPHSSEIYASYMESLFALRREVKIHGDRYGIISLINRSEREANVMTGIITTFTKIESDGPWFDSQNLSEANDNQVSQVRIPDHLHPNSASFDFLFDTVKHLLYVEMYSNGKIITPSSAYKFFQTLSSDLNIISSYGPAKISIVQDKIGLDRLFSIDVIRQVTVSIAKPNADILSPDFARRIEHNLEQSNARKLTLSWESEPGESLHVTEDMREAGEVALSNGFVEVRGRDNGAAVKQSTNDFPKTIQTTYDPQTSSESQAFRRLIEDERRGE